MKLTKQITDLRKFYNSIDIPTQTIQLKSGETITDCFKFIKSHITIAIANDGNYRFKPYLDRLEELKTILKNK